MLASAERERKTEKDRGRKRKRGVGAIPNPKNPEETNDSIRGGTITNASQNPGKTQQVEGEATDTKPSGIGARQVERTDPLKQVPTRQTNTKDEVAMEIESPSTQDKILKEKTRKTRIPTHLDGNLIIRVHRLEQALQLEVVVLREVGLGALEMPGSWVR